MNIMIGDSISLLRRKRGITQEVLAQALDVTTQAVSKWETSSCYPDIMLLPRLAQFFGVTIDCLFAGHNNEKSDFAPSLQWEDDDKLRIVQFRGHSILGEEEWRSGKKIALEIPDGIIKNAVLNFEVWGSCEIDGNVSGTVSAGDGVNCGDIGGAVAAGDGVNCGNVSGPVSAGDGVNCGNVSGPVSAGGGVNCGNVSHDVSAGNNVSCGDIGNYATAENGDIRCRSIKGNVQCHGNIIYEN